MSTHKIHARWVFCQRFRSFGLPNCSHNCCFGINLVPFDLYWISLFLFFMHASLQTSLHKQLYVICCTLLVYYMILHVNGQNLCMGALPCRRTGSPWRLQGEESADDRVGFSMCMDLMDFWWHILYSDSDSIDFPNFKMWNWGLLHLNLG